jgi:hypothetical protein
VNRLVLAFLAAGGGIRLRERQGVMPANRQHVVGSATAIETEKAVASCVIVPSLSSG